ISKSVLSEETAYLMIEMLRAVVNEGTGAGLTWQFKIPYGPDIGGKTGTTQNNSDGWFVGVTPKLVCGIWVGNSDRSVHFPTTAWGQGSKMAMPIFGRMMKKVYDDPDFVEYKKTIFQRPKHLDVETNCSKYEESDSTDTPTNSEEIKDKKSTLIFD
ncbi:MAG: penicillin-binding transpeptidase domain-containing protein, partial [Bacteroidia bacterium]|nr:penicillin-binding transpeptidase domain-containing protein [Bacteroidia bacterium]